MTKTTSAKQLCITAVCIALCCILPQAFHALALGSVFSPMHIPVLLCGLVCGGGYGLICGIAGPVLSSLLTGMPSAAALSFMLPELMVYGLVSGMMMQLLRSGKLCTDLYTSLITAMVLGRIAGGMASAVFYMGRGQAFSLAIWASSYFLGTLPGIVVQLILIPILVATLMKARVLPCRY